MNQQDPSTSLNDINERQTSKGSEDTKFRLAQSVISHALKKSEEVEIPHLISLYYFDTAKFRFQESGPFPYR